ncbi:sensor histidine kinase [Corynebacterium heidelbergense]|uniref:histidine kinase n=1 Tax=Corynebacterium heidelbergense TaxID=2055947 RepID=A0A364V5A7_9CORY|nr:histidine kinase [Corynebacterium heidelbergense]RAV31798.1 hypothetical protein DLJ54_06495 [Corynebacterium heidelbergense]
METHNPERNPTTSSHPHATPTSPWWKEKGFWVRLAVQTAVLLTFGPALVAGPQHLHGFQVLGVWVSSVVVFVGLLVQRWRARAGLAVVAVGLGVAALTATGGVMFYYVVVVYEAWYITAFLSHRKWVLLGALWAGSEFAVGWLLWAPYGIGQPLFDKQGMIVTATVLRIVTLTVLITVSIGFGALWGRGTWRRNYELQTLRARAELATMTERNRIAREMHDIIAHTLTLVIAQADGGRYAGQREPDKALQALDTISERSRAALVHMRGLLSVLRDDNENDRSVDSAPGVAGIPDLVEDAKRHGLNATLRVEGTVREMDDVRSLTAYRVVQECLTNVLKHAGFVLADISLTWGEEAVSITVDNAPGNADAAPERRQIAGSGRGLTGLKERVRIHGGQVTWGPSQRYPGGWTVVATLPY